MSRAVKGLKGKILSALFRQLTNKPDLAFLVTINPLGQENKVITGQLKYLPSSFRTPKPTSKFCKFNELIDVQQQNSILML